MKNIVILEKDDIQLLRDTSSNLKSFIEYYRSLDGNHTRITSLLDAEEKVNSFISKFDKLNI